MHPILLFLQEIEMESTISTQNLKSKLDRKQVTIVETLAPVKVIAAQPSVEELVGVVALGRE
jgi:hypothetical protein